MNARDEAEPIRPCVRYRDKTWWLDPDIAEGDATEPENFEELQTRAALLCYDCYVLAQCRVTGAVETYNLWGGLTSEQRRRIARGQPAVHVKQLPFSERLNSEDIEAFKSGVSVQEISRKTGRDEADVLLALKRLLRRTQLTWEKANAHIHDRVSFLVRQAQIDGA